MNSSVRAELDFALPEGGTALRELVEPWFADAVRELAGSAMDPFVGALDLTGRESALMTAGAPYGRPGELWGSLWIARVLKSGRKRSGRVFSPKNWEKFLRDLESVPLEAELRLAVLGPDGYPGSTWITIGARRDYEAPEWVALTVDRSSEEFEKAQSARHDFIIRHADSGRGTALFGCIADDMDSTTGRSSLEAALGLFQDETFPVLDRNVRGYSWITVCSPGVAELLGGAEAVRRDGTFAQVRGVAGGSLFLKATEDVREYGDDRVLAVFEPLRAVLPAGTPSSFISDRKVRLVFRDAR